VRARAVVNAAGVWSDDVRSLDEGTHPDSIRPAKGVHVTIPWHLTRNDIAVIIPVPKDKRSLFLVPWGRNPDGTFQHTYVGTTDTDWRGPLDDPQCTKDDVDYVLSALNAALATSQAAPVTAADITGVWAGLRPLVKGAGAKSAPSGRTADLSRRHSVRRSDSDVVTVTGGKLTTYREMAQDTIDAIQELLSVTGRCRTKRLQLRGAAGYRAAALGTPADHLGGRYGALHGEVEALIADDATLADPLVPGLPYLRAEAVYAVQHEMAQTLDDVLSRRTRALLFDRDATLAAAPAVATLIGPHLGWDDTTVAAQVAHFRDLCAAEVAAALVPEAELLGSIS
jgi:glycerol-3-phosphate dehydrogenase